MKSHQVSGNLSKRGKMDLALKKKKEKTAVAESTESEGEEEDDIFGVSGGGRPPFTSTQESS